MKSTLRNNKFINFYAKILNGEKKNIAAAKNFVQIKTESHTQHHLERFGDIVLALAIHLPSTCLCLCDVGMKEDGRSEPRLKILGPYLSQKGTTA